ncbi:unnamed protein product [Hymenolepis diminuta]|uniref:HTH La-type RNA-binding domain-containing protein n=1 Tax=Hymenolepis diminuta TaxID=6216 RepID=A0A0R3SFJ2_HYMDI|nr:unnamed protein product [Hymenolepis diminuta]VUZ49118.1 unnamed protein product [Hymenolepis diminuta]
MAQEIMAMADAEVLKEDNSSNVQITFSTEPTSKVESSTLKHNHSALEYKILKQIEFYFSDANILKDQYILKAVKSNKEGWVKLSTVAAFRRVQMLTSDEDLIRKVLRRSEQLEVSEDGTRIRRRNPLPEWDRSVYQRSVLITHFKPNELVTISQIAKFFKANDLCVTLVRIIDTNRPIPSDLIKTANHLGYLGKEKCAVVEFDTKEAAMKALPLTQTLFPDTFSTLCQVKIKSTKKENFQYASPATANNTTNGATHRPQISLKSKYSDVRVQLIRDPVSPATEDCVGFDSTWRESLRLERLNIQGTSNVPATPTANKTPKNIGGGTEEEGELFFTPTAPSPVAGMVDPPRPPKVPAPSIDDSRKSTNLLMFDDAIAFMGPPTKSP